MTNSATHYLFEKDIAVVRPFPSKKRNVSIIPIQHSTPWAPPVSLLRLTFSYAHRQRNKKHARPRPQNSNECNCITEWLIESLFCPPVLLSLCSASYASLHPRPPLSRKVARYPTDRMESENGSPFVRLLWPFSHLVLQRH
ncbi:hypothetical protein JTE90_011789 [Oedothorax gibbosus]|uniref:Uncharacterized protein n=1 Tax=Oedothorax gibbosus TaxID=931172 RepID=A0AAV6VU56_9ARAC|nr:hypothetical protein JTE90_011789 [Oedothorax gibbosus]